MPVPSLQISGIGGVFVKLGNFLADAPKHAKDFMKAEGKVIKQRWQAYKAQGSFGERLVTTGKRGYNFFKGIFNVFSDMFGVFMQFADATGVLGPIQDLLSGVFAIIGGAIWGTESFRDAFQNLVEVLFSEESMELWTTLGTIIGNVLGTILNKIAEFLSTKEGQDFLIRTVMLLGSIVGVLGQVFFNFLSILTMFPPSVIGTIFYALGIGIAFLIGMAMGGIAGLVVGALFAGFAAFILSPLLGLQTGGIVTRPTTALIGEGGEPEAVVPLSKAGSMGFGGGNDLLYATQDTNDKLDLIIHEMRKGKRLK